jgi:hypothetical protein
MGGLIVGHWNASIMQAPNQQGHQLGQGVLACQLPGRLFKLRPFLVIHSRQGKGQVKDGSVLAAFKAG